MTTKNAKKFKIFLLVILIFFGSFLLFRPEKNTAPVEFVKAEFGDIKEQATAVGSIEPKQIITVKSPMSGIVGQVFHQEGDAVEKGAPLLEVSPNPTPEQYAQNKRSFEQLRAAEASAQQHYERLKKLVAAGYVNEDEFSKAQSDYLQAKANRQLAEEKLQLMEDGKINISGKKIENIIVSPVDGYILQKMVEVGDPVVAMSTSQAGSPLLTIANMHAFMFKGDVSELDAGKLHADMPAEITLSALPNVKFSGTLTQISLQSDLDKDKISGKQTTASSTDSPFNNGFEVWIEKLQVPNDITLRAGYSASATIDIRTKQHVLLIPERVVHFGKNQTYVLLPTKNPTQPKKQKVTTGFSDGIHIEIVEGLKPGESVIASGASAFNSKRQHSKK